MIGCSYFFSLFFDFSNARSVRGQESLVALGRTEPMVHNTHGSLFSHSTRTSSLSLLTPLLSLSTRTSSLSTHTSSLSLLTPLSLSLYSHLFSLSLLTPLLCGCFVRRRSCIGIVDFGIEERERALQLAVLVLFECRIQC